MQGNVNFGGVIMRKLILTVALLVLLVLLNGCVDKVTSSLHSSAPVATTDALNQTKDNLDQWLGEYSYYEFYPPNQSMIYDLSIHETDGIYFADFSIDGFQTMSRFQATVTGDDNTVDFIFDNYLAENLFTPYEKGDKLLTFKKNNGEILTYWEKVQPMLPEHESGKVYFLNADAPYSAEKDYIIIGSHLMYQTTDVLFGGIRLGDAVNALGEPDKKTDMDSFVRYYFKQGIEIDAGYDDAQALIYDIYVDSACPLKIQRDIGIGSTRDELNKAYAEEINPKLSKDNVIVAGSDVIGITFVLDNDRVTEIVINTGWYVGDKDPRDIPT
jgi:hypothetical protein